MKKSIFTLAIATLMVGTMLTNCQSSARKVENAEDKVEDANDKVAEANQELNEEIRDSILQFKKESEEKFIAHEKSIAQFKARIAKEKIENKAEYDKKLAELEQKNTDLKKKLDEYKEEGKEKWKIFRTEFNKDMEDLGKSFKNLTVKSVK
ncbi:MAG: hypothetical protein HGB12_01020 [Bacteroidetes bacterium]|nr:hypothetical protein [Bacteroidota bacterium]